MKYKLINKKIFSLALAMTISTQVIPAYSASEEISAVSIDDGSNISKVNEYDVSTISSSSGGINTLASPTQQQIASKYSSLKIGTNVSMSFDVEPDFEKGIYGELSSASLNYALNVFNYIRYVAGLDSNVKLSDENNSKAQAIAFVLASYGKGLTRDLSEFTNSDGSTYIPEGMSDDDYQLAVDGATSNLSAGKSTLKSALISSWLSDSNDSNITTVGHRRNMLSPTLEKTGFGYAYNVQSDYNYYSANYVWDSSVMNSSTSIESVAWPARNTPVDLFANDDPWSYSDIASNINTSDVKVKLEKLNDDKSVSNTWEFNSKSSGDKYFNITTNNYGSNKSSNCLIFRPDNVKYSSGDVFKVTITNSSGNKIIDEYEVNFFDINNPSSNSSSSSSSSSSGSSSSNSSSSSSSSSDSSETTSEVTEELSSDITNPQEVEVEEEIESEEVVVEEKDPSITLKFKEPLVDFLSEEDYYKSLEAFTNFTDLENNYMTSWANSAIAFGLGQGYLYSESETEFNPSENVSRAMMVQVLSNMVEDISAFVYDENIYTFNDVLVSDYYSSAVAWAFDKEITYGTSETEFSPTDDVSRQEMALFFIRFVDALGLELPEVNEELVEFTDMHTAEFTSDDSTESIDKLQKAGIIQGDGDGTFRPSESINKAEFATMVKKLVELLIVEEVILEETTIVEEVIQE